MTSGVKYGRFVTIDDRVVFIGGPGSGAGGASAGSVTGKLPAATYVEGLNTIDAARAYAKEQGQYGSYQLREEVADAISEQTGVDKVTVVSMIEVWSGGSNYSHSVVAQQEAAKVFGSGLSEWQKEEFRVYENPGYHNPYEAEVLVSAKDARKVLNAMYENTQRKLADSGVPEIVTLRRGIRGTPPGKVGDVVNVYENALSSFTTRDDTARNFASKNGGYIIEIQVPRSRILSTARTGFGTISEDEFVLIGNNTGAGDQVKIVGIR